ncbi:MAG: PAS domain-containing sensor histidine kinase [Candidatus Omnitrophica bacterium]|nr:PAS domain-containing sensor histidine kinase [Candidatus Omnitrophota bacterium]
MPDTRKPRQHHAGEERLGRKSYIKERLEEAVIELSTVIERIDEGITLSDSKGHFVIFNSKIEEITGYKMEEANAQKDFLSLLHPGADERRKAFERLGEVAKKGRIYEAESTITAKDGTVKTLLISTSLIHHMGREMFLSVYRDISKYKKFNELKDDFIDMVSHELRTPLSIIREGINIILDEIPGKINDQQAKILISAKDSIERLKRILNNLLDLSKIESDKTAIKKEVMDIAALMKNVLLSFGPRMREKGLEAKMDLPESEIKIYADKDMMTQVMTNLIDNAIKFTNNGFIKVSAKELKEGFECSVSDSGIGIADENLPKIFGKFQQFGHGNIVTREKGTGLGLLIAKKFVDMQGGNIRVESRLGKGTEVIFALPKYVKAKQERGCHG